MIEEKERTIAELQNKLVQNEKEKGLIAEEVNRLRDKDKEEVMKDREDEEEYSEKRFVIELNPLENDRAIEEEDKSEVDIEENEDT